MRLMEIEKNLACLNIYRNKFFSKNVADIAKNGTIFASQRSFRQHIHIDKRNRFKNSTSDKIFSFAEKSMVPDKISRTVNSQSTRQSKLVMSQC